MFPEEEESGLLTPHRRRRLLRAGVEPVAVHPVGHQPQAMGSVPAQCRAPRLRQMHPVKGFPSVSCWVWIFFSQTWTIWVEWAASPLGGHLLGDPGVWLEGTLRGAAGSPANTPDTRCLCLQRALPRMPEASSVPVGILRGGHQARARGAYRRWV